MFMNEIAIHGQICSKASKAKSNHLSISHTEYLCTLQQTMNIFSKHLQTDPFSCAFLKHTCMGLRRTIPLEFPKLEHAQNSNFGPLDISK